MCWLCTFQGEPLGLKLTAFIIKNIGIMDMNCIAQQVSDYLLLQEPDTQDADQPTVREHIARHMLHPRVRMAVMLRQLLDFSTLLQATLVLDDNGVCSVDKGNTDLYLKVIAQIMTLYKADTTGMLFADDEKGANMGGAASSSPMKGI